MKTNNRLSIVNHEITICKTCKFGKIGKVVVGEGNADANIMFIGEAPGRKESMTGRPFVGRSGQLLRRVINESGIREKDVYITSPVKYLPKKGTPSSKDIKHGMKHLNKQIDAIDPKVLVLLGSVACKGVLGESIPVLKEHGKIVKQKGRIFLVTIHPAAVLRFPKYKSIFSEDFKNIKKLLQKY